LDIRELIRAGHGDIKADTVITNGQLINVASSEIYPAEVAIKSGHIVAIGEVDHCKGPNTKFHDANGRYLAPGMIDGHLHVECSKLSVSSFADLVVPYGTTSIVSGLDQILVVSGLEGVRHFLDEANTGPMTIHWGAPCKTPYTMPRSTVNHYFSPDDHRETHEWPECIGIWETVREFIQEEDDHVIEALEIARKNKLPVFGCSPMCKGGAKLAGYVSAGVRLDHESYEVSEALEKLRNGMFILIRESSISHFLKENIQLVTKHAPETAHRVSFCTDDVVATDVLKRGHLDNMVRMAIREGVDPMEAIQMATINSAVALQIDHKVGLIAPGRQADIVLVDSPETFNVEEVIAKGEFVAQGHKMLKPVARPLRPKFLTETMKVASVSADDLKVRARGEKVKVLSMNMSLDVPFVRNRRDAVLNAANGVVLPDTEQDVLYVSVIERYGKTTNKPVAFVSGFGLKYGAMATSTAPDDNNIVCIGTNPEDMAAAINWIIEKGGGQAFVKEGEVIVGLELPIGGIVSDIDPIEMAAKEDALDQAARDAGCLLEWPFMNMFVLSITAIPEFAITDMGAVDCVGLKTFNPVLEDT